MAGRGGKTSGSWKKGQSGNPGGQVKTTAEVRDLARVHTVEAIERLVHWMRSDSAKASIQAAQAILDRGYGKPVQAVSGPDGEGPLVVQIVRYGNSSNPE